MKQRGYYDLNVTGFIIGCLIVGAARAQAACQKLTVKANK